MTENATCPKCGAELPENAPAGICPTCLMQAGLASEAYGGSSPAMKPTTHMSGFVPPEPEELAKHFPQLEIVELLGKGGMGAVYKARQPGLDRLVALKILPPEIGADPAFAERFTREARALAKLSHQNIVSVFDFGQTTASSARVSDPGETDDRRSPTSDETFGQPSGSVGDRPQQPLYYFIMEFVDGTNLRQLIETGGLKPEEALAIVPQICEALQFAHDAGIVHRDIKPENLLVDRQGRVKIADFGLAKLLGKPPAEFTLTGTHQVMGTLHYMAPEQMRGAGTVDHRADIYSLGVVFYEMLTGQLPIGKFEPPSNKVHIDVRLDEVVLRSLENEPAQRYQNVSEVKSAVEQVSSTWHCPAALAARRNEAYRNQPGLLAKLPLWAKLAAWTGAIGFVCLFLLPLVMTNWMPWNYDEQWEFGFNSESGAYRAINLSVERTLKVWGRGEADPHRLISKTPWIATAKIRPADSEAAVTLSLDSFRETWLCTARGEQVWWSQDEPHPDWVVQWMKDCGIDVSQPGLRDEATALISMVKDAADGVLLDKSLRDVRTNGAGLRIGPLTTDGGSRFELRPRGMVGLSTDIEHNEAEQHWISVGAFLVIWLPGALIVLRRHRRLQRTIQRRAEDRTLGAELDTKPRFSHKAIVGFCWAPLFFVLLGATTLSVRGRTSVPNSEDRVTVTSNRQDGEADSAATTETTTEPIVAKDARRPRDPAWWQWALIVTLFPLGLTAPFGTTILGVLSINDIRHSQGRLTGMPLALADSLLYPLLLLDGVIVGLFWLLCLVAYEAFGPGTPMSARAEWLCIAITALLSVPACAYVDFLIIRAAWSKVGSRPGA